MVWSNHDTERVLGLLSDSDLSYPISSMDTIANRRYSWRKQFCVAASLCLVSLFMLVFTEAMASYYEWIGVVGRICAIDLLNHSGDSSKDVINKIQSPANISAILTQVTGSSVIGRNFTSSDVVRYERELGVHVERLASENSNFLSNLQTGIIGNGLFYCRLRKILVEKQGSFRCT